MLARGKHEYSAAQMRMRHCGAISEWGIDGWMGWGIDSTVKETRIKVGITRGYRCQSHLYANIHSPSLIEEARIKMSVVTEKPIAAKARRLPHLSSAWVEHDLMITFIVVTIGCCENYLDEKVIAARS